MSNGNMIWDIDNRSKWDTTKTYTSDFRSCPVVQYENSVYVCILTSTQGIPPPEQPDVWVCISTLTNMESLTGSNSIDVVNNDGKVEISISENIFQISNE